MLCVSLSVLTQPFLSALFELRRFTDNSRVRITAADHVCLPGFRSIAPPSPSPYPALYRCHLFPPPPPRPRRVLDGPRPFIRFYAPLSPTDMLYMRSAVWCRYWSAQNPHFMRFYRPLWCLSILRPCSPGTPQVKQFGAHRIMLRPDRTIIRSISKLVQGPILMTWRR